MALAETLKSRPLRRISRDEYVKALLAANGLPPDFKGTVRYPVFKPVRDADGQLVRDEAGAVVVNEQTRRVVTVHLGVSRRPMIRRVSRRAPRSRARRAHASRGSPARGDPSEPPLADLARFGERFSLLERRS